MAEKKNLLTREGLRKLEDELQDLKVNRRQEIAQKIKEAREQGDLSENAEYDAATGRPRRVGPFDAVASAYGLKCQNSDLIALTKLDILSYMREIPIITGYKYKNTVVKEFDPTDNIDMYKPVVELMPGWLTDISKYRTYDELPDNARNYIEKLEKLLNHEIQFISVGAERNQYLTKGEWL